MSQLPCHRRPPPSAKLRSRIAYETSSCRRNPSIDADRLPCDPRGIVRAEKRDGRRHIVGIGDAKRCELCRLAEQARAELVFHQAIVDRRAADERGGDDVDRSEEHTSELQSLMRISYAVFCLKKKTNKQKNTKHKNIQGMKMN